MDSENFVIEMKSIQSIYNDRTETELVTAGKFRRSDDKFLISYLDSEATGFEGSETEITVTGNKLASIIRRGNSSSDLVIEPGKRHHCHYSTPYGDMVIGIYTHTIENKLSENGGSLYMKYTIDINTSYMSDNEIIMNIKEAPHISG